MSSQPDLGTITDALVFHPDPWPEYSAFVLGPLSTDLLEMRLC